jgi:CelD/BcsL family acetyltransferase involved in cellulose biosynthesis
VTSLRVDLLAGEHARALLGDPAFVDGWRQLLDASPDTPPFPGPQFCLAWYAAYAATWEPLLLVGVLGDGACVAVWPLARHRSEPTVVHAGSHQAEYPGWLAAPEHEYAFLDHAWRLLAASHSFGTLRMRYLPGEPTLERIRRIPALRRRLVAEPVSVPVVSLDEASLRAAEASRNFKTKLNRLKRLGAVTLRTVTIGDGFEDAFARLVALYDLRQGAANGVLPFTEDASKADFHRALARDAADIVDFSVLECGERVVSACWCMVGTHAAHVAIIAYAAELSACSPGRIHLTLLARRLAERGLETLDLTPGGSWKATMASRQDRAFDAVLFRSAARAALERTRRRVVRAVRACLAGDDGLATLLRRARDAVSRARSPGGRDTANVHAPPVVPVAPSRWCIPDAMPAAPALHVDAAGDIVVLARALDPDAPSRPLSVALARLEAGEHCLTPREDAEVRWGAWVSWDEATRDPAAPLVRIVEIWLPAGADDAGRRVRALEGVLAHARARGARFVDSGPGSIDADVLVRLGVLRAEASPDTGVRR